MTPHPKPHQAGAQLRCPTCGATYTALGTEIAALCTGGDRHRITRMAPVENAESREKKAS